jgi:hypothetical protein
MGKKLGTIGKIGAVAAAPFTGGASLSLLAYPDAIGGILGAITGANNMFGKQDKQKAPKAMEAAPFKPVRPGEVNRPQSLNELAAFSPEQARSSLATQGLNQGLGAEEDSYYRNLLQRSLIGEGNKVDTSNPNFLMPIESQYFSQQGKNTSDIMEFLRGISG